MTLRLAASKVIALMNRKKMKNIRETEFKYVIFINKDREGKYFI